MKNYFKTLYRRYISQLIRKAWRIRLSNALSQSSSIELSSDKHKGDTFFILGNGSSINNISDEQWKHIAKNTSIGINFWLVHDFVPNFYIAELPRDKDRGVQWVNLVKERYQEYKNAAVKIFVKVPYVKKQNTEKLATLEMIPSELYDNLSLISSFPIGTENIKTVLSVTNRYIDECKAKGKIEFIAQMRGSIVGAYLVGVILGFEKIVFCGVDLNDTKYFYSENADYYHAKNRTVPSTGYALGAVHGNVKKVENTLDVIELIELLDSHFREKFQVKTYNINPKSRLAEILPLYEE